MKIISTEPGQKPASAEAKQLKGQSFKKNYKLLNIRLKIISTGAKQLEGILQSNFTNYFYFAITYTQNGHSTHPLNQLLNSGKWQILFIPQSEIIKSSQLRMALPLWSKLLLPNIVYPWRFVAVQKCNALYAMHFICATRNARCTH